MCELCDMDERKWWGERQCEWMQLAGKHNITVVSLALPNLHSVDEAEICI